MGSEDNKFKEEYLVTTRARKCIKISFFHQLYSVLQVELHSTEEFNPLLLLLPSGDREQSSVLLSTPQSGTQSIQRQKLKFVPQNTRRVAEQRPSASASQPPGRSAPQSTRKTVSINGRDMAMIRCGLQLLELARVIH